MLKNSNYGFKICEGNFGSGFLAIEYQAVPITVMNRRPDRSRSRSRMPGRRAMERVGGARTIAGRRVWQIHTLSFG